LRILLPTFACKLEADTWDDVIAIAAAASSSLAMNALEVIGVKVIGHDGVGDVTCDGAVS